MDFGIISLTGVTVIYKTTARIVVSFEVESLDDTQQAGREVSGCSVTHD